jgi:tmRNA-binding protein
VKEITVKISNSNFEKLKKSINKDKTVNVALKQFFQKNHKMKVRMLLKRGYKTFGKLNLRLSRVLSEDASF